MWDKLVQLIYWILRLNYTENVEVIQINIRTFFLKKNQPNTRYKQLITLKKETNSEFCWNNNFLKVYL